MTIEDIVNVLKSIDEKLAEQNKEEEKPDAVKESYTFEGALADMKKVFNPGGVFDKIQSGMEKFKAGQNIWSQVSGSFGEAGAAGGAGEAAGGAEAVAALGEAGASGGPIGLVIAAVIALSAAIVVLPPMLADWANSIIESKKALAEFSGPMQQVFAQREIYQINRSMRQGDLQAESTGHLEDAYERLQDALDGIITPITNILTEILAYIVDFVAAAIYVGEAGLVALEKFNILPEAALKWLRQGDEGKGEGNINEWMVSAAAINTVQQMRAPANWPSA